MGLQSMWTKMAVLTDETAIVGDFCNVYFGTLSPCGYQLWDVCKTMSLNVMIIPDQACFSDTSKNKSIRYYRT